MPPNHLFVYGSLKRGCAPPQIADVMESLAYVGGGSIRGRFHGSGPYPGATFDESDATEIVGEIYRLPKDDEETLKRLDDYEEFCLEAIDRSLFVREDHCVKGENGQLIRCWVYSPNLNRRT